MKSSNQQGEAFASDRVLIRTQHCDDGARLTVNGTRYIRQDGRWVALKGSDR